MALHSVLFFVLVVASRFIFEVPSTLKTNFLSGEELHGNLNDSEQDDDYVILRENPVRDVLVIGMFNDRPIV